MAALTDRTISSKSRVFPKIDHSVRMCPEFYWVKNLVKSLKNLAKISQGFGKIILNMWQIFIKYLAKFYLNIKFYATTNA